MEETCKITLYNEVLRAAHNEGISIENGCLPVSLLALDIIRRRNRLARIVIGEIWRNGAFAHLGQGNQIISFMLDTESLPPPFHAWIDLGKNDLADFTIGRTWKNHFPSEFENAIIDGDDAKWLHLCYRPILETAEEIAYFERAIMHRDTPGQDRRPLTRKELNDNAERAKQKPTLLMKLSALLKN